MRPFLTAILCLAAPTLGSAQIGPGQAVVSTGSGFVTADPLDGTTRPLPWNLLPPAGARTAAIGATPTTLFIGTSAPARLFTATVGGSGLSSTQLVSSALGAGDVQRVLPLSGGSVVVATTTSIYTVTPSQPPLLAGTAANGTIVDACLVRPGGGLAWIESRFAGTVLELRTTTLPSISTAIPVASPIALVHLPALGGFVIASASGRLAFVDNRSFATRAWGQVNHGATAMTVHQSGTAVLVAGGGQLSVVDNGTTVFQNPLATAGPVTGLDFEPEASDFAPFGTGCPTSRGALPTIGANGRPYPGNRGFAVTCTNVPAGRLALMVLGFQQIATPLAGFGLPGCTLWVDPFQTFSALTTPLGTTARPLPIPPDPVLRGTQGFVQWAVIDPTVNATGLAFSDGGILSI